MKMCRTINIKVLTILVTTFQFSGLLFYFWWSSIEKVAPATSVRTTALPFDVDYVLTLTEDHSQHFQDVALAKNCYVEGTDVAETRRLNGSQCQCKADYYGAECGIPAPVWFRPEKINENQWRRLKPRKIPRRIVHALNINHEIDFFKARLEELQDAVDGYIVCESNYTAHGDSKSLTLLDQLRSGFQSGFQSKIVYVPLIQFPSQGYTDGWFIDRYMRTYMGIHGLKRIRGMKGDDLLLLLDADEFPTRQVLMFLKLYDGYSEPIRLAMSWSVFGFFWKRKRDIDSTVIDWIFQSVRKSKEHEERLLQITAVSTMSMVREVYGNNIFLLRQDTSNLMRFQDRLSRYSDGGHDVGVWTIGTAEHYGGHHCSWCLSPEGIRTKLLSAHVDDKPRWGDYPDKTDLSYIRRLIRNGEWFDGTHPFVSADPDTQKHYAPTYMLDHPELFYDILHLPLTSNETEIM